MNKTDFLRFWRYHLRHTVPRLLVFYLAGPAALLLLLSGPVSRAVTASGAAAAFLILLAALAVVGLNEYAYILRQRKKPSLLVLSWGLLCLLLVVIIEHEALPGTHPLTSPLAVIGGFLVLAFLLLLSFHLAKRRAKAAHSAAVVIWVILFLVLCAMIYQAARDFEAGIAGLDTWITVFSIFALILGACAPWILSSRRKKAALLRKTGQTEGTICQIVGETRLDRDGDAVTRNHALIRYQVDGVPYETKADISRFTTRRFGKSAFVGRKVPVFYDPASPSETAVRRIDKHIFDQDKKEKEEE